MITAKEAREKAAAARDAYNPSRQQKLFDGIKNAIEHGEYGVYLNTADGDFLLTSESKEKLSELGYKVKEDTFIGDGREHTVQRVEW